MLNPLYIQQHGSTSASSNPNSATNRRTSSCVTSALSCTSALLVAGATPSTVPVQSPQPAPSPLPSVPPLDLPPSRAPSLVVQPLCAERLSQFVGGDGAAAAAAAAGRSEHSLLDDVGRTGGASSAAAEPTTWRQRLRIVLPHVGLVVLSAAYTVLGAIIFNHLEMPYELQLRNETAIRVARLKRDTVDRLWRLHRETDPLERAVFQAVAEEGMDEIIRDVFVDYTRNYMTPDDIIFGDGPIKWSFGSALFFSWTAITTIADLGRFLSGGIILVNHWWRALRREAVRRLVAFCRRAVSTCLCCWRRRRKRAATAGERGKKTGGGNGRPQQQPNGALPTIEISSARTTAGGGAGHATRFERRRRKRRRRQQDPQQRISAKDGVFRALVHGEMPSMVPPSETGTFDDISDIRSVDADTSTDGQDEDEDVKKRLPSESTDSEEEEEEEEDEDNLMKRHQQQEAEGQNVDHQERRVSVLFVLIIMIGYTVGGACLLPQWEAWSFFDAFYYSFVSVTTIGFGDITPMNVDFLPATLIYVLFGLIITTMCIGLSVFSRIQNVQMQILLEANIHFYGRSLGRSFMTIGGKVVHLGEVFGYVAFLQKNYGLTAEQLGRLAQLPEEYLLDCLVNGREPDVAWLGGRRPFVPSDIYYFKWIEHPRTLSFTSDRMFGGSLDSIDAINTSRCSTARTLTPREYYQRILLQYCKHMQPPVGGAPNNPRTDPIASLNARLAATSHIP